MDDPEQDAGVRSAVPRALALVVALLAAISVAWDCDLPASPPCGCCQPNPVVGPDEPPWDCAGCEGGCPMCSTRNCKNGGKAPPRPDDDDAPPDGSGA